MLSQKHVQEENPSAQQARSSRLKRARRIKNDSRVLIPYRMYLPHPSSTASSKQIPAKRYTKPKSKAILHQDPDSRLRGRLYRRALGARRRRAQTPRARHQETPSSPSRDASQYPSSHGSKPRKSETLARISCCFFFTLPPSVSN
jgi:hypothetical protein